MSTCHQRTPSALSPGVQDAAPGLTITFSNTTGSIQLLGVHPSQLHQIGYGFSVW